MSRLSSGLTGERLFYLLSFFENLLSFVSAQVSIIPWIPSHITLFRNDWYLSDGWLGFGWLGFLWFRPRRHFLLFWFALFRKFWMPLYCMSWITTYIRFYTFIQIYVKLKKQLQCITSKFKCTTMCKSLFGGKCCSYGLNFSNSLLCQSSEVKLAAWLYNLLH